MAFWLEILQATALGELERASEIWRDDLPLALREFSFDSAGFVYKGVLTKRVESFISAAAQTEKEMLRSRQEDLIDYILEGILNHVKRTYKLLEFCLAFPEKTLEQVVESFQHWDGYKRDSSAKIKYVADLLCSMIDAGIQLPEKLKEKAFTQGEAKYKFEEIALVKRWDIGRSWLDFKKKQEIGGVFKCINDTTENTGVEAEGFEYDVISMSEVVSQLVKTDDQLSFLEMKELSEKLNPEIENLVKERHAKRPKHGYQQIAGHKVFWDLTDRYETIPLNLNLIDPECRTDEILAEYITKNYLEVEKPSRQNINERRLKLYRGCEEKIKEKVIECVSKI